MTAGKLSAAKPAATTETTLYQCPIDKASSTVLEVCNQSSTATSYRVALRNYDQILTLDGDYTFAKGNVVSGYTIDIAPGIPVSDFTPGDKITLDNNQGSFKIQDVFQESTIIEYLVKVTGIGSVPFDNISQTGFFEVGDTVTGNVTGFDRGVLYRVDPSLLYFSIPQVTAVSTDHYINDNTGVSANDYIYTDGEIMQISAITGYNVTVTRGQIGTTATVHDAGTGMIVFRPDTVTAQINEGATFSDTDTTLTLNSTTGFQVGSYIKIDNEFLEIVQITGQDITVLRGQLGSTAASHADTTVVTQQVTVTTGQFEFYQLDEEVTNGPETLNLNIPPTSGDAFTPENAFVYNDGAGGSIYEYPSTINADAFRVLKFNQSDSSNTGHPLRISLDPTGSVALTAGVTINGTPGSAGAYTLVDLDLQYVNDNSTYYTYCANHPNMGVSITIDLTPNYTTIYVLDVTKGLLETTDTFSIGNVDYTVIGVTQGPYGYVHEVVGTSPSVIKVSLGESSIPFATTDQFFDSPTIPASARTLAEVSSISTIDDVDYIYYDKALSGNASERTTGLVVGPGQSLMVYSTNATISYNVHGFEDSTNDFVPNYYIRESTSGATGPVAP